MTSYVVQRSPVETVQALGEQSHPSFIAAFFMNEELSDERFTYGQMSDQIVIIDNQTLTARVMSPDSSITTLITDLTPEGFKFAALEHHMRHEDIEAFPTEDQRELLIDAITLGEMNMRDGDIPTGDDFRRVRNVISLLGIQGMTHDDAIEMMEMYGLMENGQPSRSAFKEDGWGVQLLSLADTVGNNERSFLSPLQLLATKLYKEEHPDVTLTAFDVANLPEEYIERATDQIETARTT